MPVSLTTPTINQNEVDYLTQVVLSKRIAKGGVEALDRIESPTVDLLMGSTKKMGAPVSGGYRFYVKGQRGQRLQWWDGADLLVFENIHTITDMQFNVGKCHMGYELLYAFLEAQGIRIKYGKENVREGAAAPGRTLEVAVNVIEDHIDSVMYDWKREIRRAVFQTNAAYPKAFTGIDGLIPVSTNSTGTIGGRSRTNQMFRHQLKTAVSRANLQYEFFDLYRKLTRKSGGTAPDIIAAGDVAIDQLVRLFQGTDTVAGKFDYRSARDKAMKKGETMNVALPDKAFMFNDTMIVNEPVFEDLDTEEPGLSVPWSNRFLFLNTRNIGVIPVVDGESVQHAMPYNQRLERVSLHGEYTVWCNRPNAQGILAVSGS